MDSADQWIGEAFTPDDVWQHRVSRVLVNTQTAFQELSIVDSGVYGTNGSNFAQDQQGILGLNSALAANPDALVVLQSIGHVGMAALIDLVGRKRERAQASRD